MKKLKKLAAIAIALVLLAIMLVATPVYAETVMVGNDPIKTEYSNYPLSNAIALIDEVFTKAGTVLSWEVYTRTPG
ncbi:MAG: hypothetical protein F6K35_32890, partial [Okeania sp. SIO2H7]|nr:hypothetical protein [Okeania sp. SIO2H7]